MPPGGSGRIYRWQVLCVLSMSCCWGFVTGQLRYSVPEESEPGTVVGNVARDLGLDAAAINKRNLALGYDASRRYFALNLDSGALVVNDKIDRELTCGPSPKCVLSEEVIVESPLEMFRVEVEILDVNDNAPSFLTDNQIVHITELVATPGTTFPLEGAQDQDVGRNAVRVYTLSPNPFFSLGLKRRGDGTLAPELVLEKVLDREEQEEFHLVLTAFDGGLPVKSGSARITVYVLDINDNAPTFERSVYNVSVLENSPANSLLIKLNASDLDAGQNGQIEYSFEEHTLKSLHDLFSVDSHTGEVRVQSPIYYEEANFYELSIQAKDQGVPVMVGRCVLYVHVEDVNDNAPEILLKSHGHSVPENTPIGTAVGFFRIRDRDSGRNGEVKLELLPSTPFAFKSFGNHYSLITDDVLDRETTSQYTITLVATDMGMPPLQTQAVIYVNISDVNDNPPRFSQPVYNAYVKENNDPGALLCTVSASDPDVGENSLLTFSIAESQIKGSPASSFVYINSLTGNVYAQRSFDFESIQVFHFTVKVEDAGSPKLSSNMSLYVFILDQNDNSPSVLYPVATNEHHVLQKIPKYVPKGYLISKVTAVDADSGHNAWLSYSLLKPTNTSLFRISMHSGEIRSTRDLGAFGDSPETLLVLVKDNGHPSLSTTVTILLSFEDSLHEERPKSHDFYVDNGRQSEMAKYLIIALVAITLVSLVTFIILFTKCRKNSSHLLCCFTSPMPQKYARPYKSALQLDADGTMKYVEVSLGPPEPLDQCYRIGFSPESEGEDFNFMKPLNFPQLKELMNEAEKSTPRTDDVEEPEQQAQPFQQSQPFQQAPTNTDWRFSAAQRPGTSGSQNSEEAGGWPNNQFETERLQAMILASANEGADGSSTLGGAGTMGLSARYGPQFTLQHVPDYRQNVYIPGSTATLTNAAGKRDGKPAASGANKKKSGKKEKK